ncbi:MAG: ATP-binding protein [Planctomycetota bacterium]
MPEDPAKPSAPVSNSPSADGPHDPPASGELPRLRSLAGSVAHDVNNLLVVVLHCLDQLEQASVAEPGREYVDQARFATQQAAAQLRHLQRGGEPLLEQDVDVDDVVRAVGSTLRIAGHGEGRVTLDLASRPGKVRGAAAELAVAVFNLVHNALEVSPAGKPVVVRTRARSLTATCSTHFRPLPAGDYVAIEVVDAGGGIAPEVQARMFEPFFSTKADSGRGLGLATVARVVGEHRGGVRVHSTPGVGTRIEVLLPRLAG